MANDKELMKRAIIAGASRAVEFKEKNWRASPEEVIQHVTLTADDILNNID